MHRRPLTRWRLGATASMALVLAGCSPTVPPAPQPIASPTPAAECSPAIAAGLECVVHPDGSGTIGTRGPDQWTLGCETDAITDDRACSLYNYNLRLFLFFTAPGTPPDVCVMGHDFPGRYAFIRVDDRPAVRTDDEGCILASRQLYDALLGGTQIVTRRVEWPYDYHVDAAGPLVGLLPAAEVARAVFQRGS